ncbi:MAG: ATPase, T2SS/T4P/T4SS family [Erysipelotrichaceae bacterium]
MKNKLNSLIRYAIKNDVSDIHFIYQNSSLNITMRGIKGIKEVKDELYDINLFRYIQYLANLDLGNIKLPQTGNFELDINNKHLYFRLSVIVTNDVSSGVLRILNNHSRIELEDLSSNKKDLVTFNRWTHVRHGLVIMSGPTGSGKTTTLHALLDRIADDKKLKVISLEDPIEIHTDKFLQLQVNDKYSLNYKNGIRELLRHDPDVIMIGEVRDEKSARMLYQCALTGHLVFTTLHCKNALEAIYRLEELGLNTNEIKQVLLGVTNQRIYSSKKTKGRICIYEILEGLELQTTIQEHTYSNNHQSIESKIKTAIESNLIYKKEASYDL